MNEPAFVRIVYYSSLKDLLKWAYPLVHPSLQFHLRPPRFNLFRLFFTVFISSFFPLFLYFYFLADLPSPRSLATIPVPLTTHIRDRNGVELYKVYKDQNRTLVKLENIPLQFRQAVLAIEDANFYKHNGFSSSGTFRAAWRTLSNQSFEGGSTITQQLVKTSLLTPERTFRRKTRELILALAVETLYTKDQILEMYLNRVSFGGTAFGVEEAAQTYFGKSALDLDLAQSSLLAGLPASPTTYSPFGAHPNLAKARQKEVLRRLVESGNISWEQAETASAQDLQFSPPKTDIQAPHFVMYIRDLLAKKYGATVVEQGGLDVTTSLDLSIQETAQKIVAEETAKIAYLHVTNGSALVTNPATGEILAMVGSRDYFDAKNDGAVNVTVALRQPGSSIKPVNYALAFSRGFTPASTIDDSPITYRVPGSPPYSPVNYDGRYHGRVTLRTALGSSYNIPAVKLLSANGVNNMLDLGRKMGISTWADSSRFGLSLTLGGGEVTILDMAVTYATLANYGNRVDLHPILSVKNSKGRVLEEFKSAPPQPVLDPKIAFLVTDILTDNSARTPAFGPRSLLVIPNNTVAVKTGTTNNLRDNWTLGYTPDRLVAVWVGNNDNTPMSYVASGVTGASPIWNKIMSALLKNSPSTGFPPPSGLARLVTCSGRSDYFLSGTTPPPCPTATPNEAPSLPRGEVGPTPIPQILPAVYNKPKWPRPTRIKTR
ncbi:MAG: penicillin-binding protein [Microgenomates group bacterium Gr01-1014_16]|nr:MAG: penicillin-binding protein [Microgenomates group bacterium Gr01-1014_16]